LRFFGRKKKPKIHKCPDCGKEWDENSLGFKQKTARGLVLSGSARNLGIVKVTNPFFNTRPKNAEEYCLKCLRDYLGLDTLDLKLDWGKGPKIV
jgi:hypothetical protein